MVTTALVHETNPGQGMTTQSQGDSFGTDFFNPVSYPVGQGHHTKEVWVIIASELFYILFSKSYDYFS